MHNNTTGWFSTVRQPPVHGDEILLLTHVRRDFDGSLTPLDEIRIAVVSKKIGYTPVEQETVFKCRDGQWVLPSEDSWWRPLPETPRQIAERTKGEFMSIAKLLARCCDERTLLEEKTQLLIQPTVKNLTEASVINDALQIIYGGREKKR